MKSLLVVSLILGTLGAASIRAETTMNLANRYAYGANTGWINARGDVTNGASIGELYCSGYLWSANLGWISLGNGPTNGWEYSNTSATDWGVNHDGEGLLTGYAYSANVGWIRFDKTLGQPRVDLGSGNLSGYAWSANTGWISLSNAQAFVQTDTLSPGPDSDADGLPDAWEYKQAGKLTVLSATGDQDNDKVSDLEEYLADTDPKNGTDFLEMLSLEPGATTNHIAWTSRPTRFYRVDATTNLSSGTWADAGIGYIGPHLPAVTEVNIPAAGSTNQFYRVTALLPLFQE